MSNDDPKPEDKPKFEFLPEPYPMTPEEKAAVLAKYKYLYTREEMERMFSEEDVWVSGEQVIAELEEVHRRVLARKQE